MENSITTPESAEEYGVKFATKTATITVEALATAPPCVFHDFNWQLCVGSQWYVITAIGRVSHCYDGKVICADIHYRTINRDGSLGTQAKSAFVGSKIVEAADGRFFSDYANPANA